MPILNAAAGITKLSQMEIDADKDWRSKGIANLKEVAAGMEHGAIAFRGASVMQRLSPDAGAGYNFLRSRGLGISPEWADIQEIVAYLTGATSRSIKVDLPPVAEPAVDSEAVMKEGLKQMNEQPLATPEPAVTAETALQAVGGQSGEQSLVVPQPAVSYEAALV